MLCNTCSTLLLKYNQHKCIKCKEKIEINMYILCDECSKKDQVCSICLKHIVLNANKKQNGCRCQSK
jgi:hypothetical protein